MHIENMNQSMEVLASAVQSQLSGGVESVCTSEMAETTDMLKDIAEALYYAKIVKSMEDTDENKVSVPVSTLLDNARYYNDSRYGSGRNMGTVRRSYSSYPEVYDPVNDYSRNRWRLGSNTESPYERSKRGYSEWKSTHSEDKSSNMSNLEEYLKNLSEDVTELIGQMDASEKALVKNKIQNLATKIV